MAVPGSSSRKFATKLLPHAWWILLLVALALFWVATERRIDRVEALTNQPTWSVDMPQRADDSPTGYENGQRALIVPGHHNPSFWWIIEAQKSVEEGKWRLRHIDYDAAPDGREIRRTALYRWWLLATGWLYTLFNDGPLGYAIERAALFADPLLLALLLVAGATYCARYLNSFASIGFIVGGVSLFPLAANFQPGAPDPHSLAWVLAVGSVLPLLALSTRTGESRKAHFAAAGAVGGLGFWNDATSQAPVLLAVAIGGLCYEFIRSRGAGPQPIDSSSWRTWGIAGGLVTLAASLFEFAPSYLTWSLDAVHPVHAVAWWGIGEVLHASSLWFRAGDQRFNRRSMVVLSLAGLAIVAWPVVGGVTGSGSLLASDFYARQLANHPSGGIASSFKLWLDRAEDGAAWAVFLPCAVLFILLSQMFSSKIDWEGRGRLALGLMVAAFTVIMAFMQLRWWNLFDALLLVALAALFAEAGRGAARTRLGALVAAVLVLPGLFVGFPPAVEDEGSLALAPLEKQALVERDFSYWLNKRSGGDPITLFSTPLFSSGATYYGGFDVVASSDSENQHGYLTAVRIASADSAQEVEILLNSRGVTHVALPMWDASLDQLVRVGMAVPPGEALPPAAFAVALREWDVAPWLRPMNYSVPQEEAFTGFELRPFALQAEQSPEFALSRLADLFVERGMMWEAKSIREPLTAYSRSVVALGAIANIDYALRDQEQLQESLETLIPYMSRRSARDLPVDRRISLAALFMRTQNADLARDQVDAALEELDPETLRALTPASVAGLLALSRALDIPFPNRELEALALELVPPAVAERLEQM